MAQAVSAGGHAFICYVREDADRVDDLQRLLGAAGVRVWRDTVDLLPGEDWRMAIRRAIGEGALAFIACFSANSAARDTSFQNEELVLAVEELRRRRPDVPWLIPVRFDDCAIPDRDIGAGRTLRSIQRADLFGAGYEREAAKLVGAVQQILGEDGGLRVLPVRDLDAEDIEMLHAREAAVRLTRMRPDSAVRVLLRASTAASAEVLDVLLTEDEALTIQVLARARRSKARDLIAAMTSPPEWLADLPTAADAMEACEREMRSVLGRGTGPLSHAGPPGAGTHGYRQDFENGQIHWSRPGGAQATAGEIDQWLRQGAGGFPLNAETSAEPNVEFGTSGRYQWFGASRFRYVVYSSRHGVFGVRAAIADFHEAEGGTSGSLGFPISDPEYFLTSDREMLNGLQEPTLTIDRQQFEGGFIYEDRGIGAIAVPEPIASHLKLNHGGSRSLEWPVSPRIEAGRSPFGTDGCYQRFKGTADYPQDILSDWTHPGGATVYTSEAHGTYCVSGAHGILYERLGGTTSWLGFPTSEVTIVVNSEVTCEVQQFEGGAIYCTEQHGAVTVPAATVDYLAGHPRLKLRLGAPVRRSHDSPPDAPVQFFDGGVVTNNGGTVEAWVRPDPE